MTPIRLVVGHTHNRDFQKKEPEVEQLTVGKVKHMLKQEPKFTSSTTPFLEPGEYNMNGHVCTTIWLVKVNG